MTISYYNASVPVFKQGLNSLKGILAKAEAHATAKNIDADAFLKARLFPDMLNLTRQVQIAADFAKGVPGRSTISRSAAPSNCSGLRASMKARVLSRRACFPTC